MLARNLKPFLTLYHWELPAALADLGGWRNRDIADWSSDYVRAVHARLGDRLASIATLPLFVTENGMALKPGDDVTDDEPRVTFIADHLRAARSAIDHRVNLRGFFYWSLLDNYEWVCGIGPRFGLVYVDYQRMTRNPKASWHAFQKMLRAEQTV